VFFCCVGKGKLNNNYQKETPEQSPISIANKTNPMKKEPPVYENFIMTRRI
jgi:hypothetical protein